MYAGGPSIINNSMHFCDKYMILYWMYFPKLINAKYFVAICVVMRCSLSSVRLSFFFQRNA